MIIAVVACIFILSTSYYIGSVYQGYENVGNITYLDQSTALANNVGAMQERIQPEGEGFTDAISYVLRSSYNAILLMFAVVPIFSSVGNGIGMIFGIPPMIINLIMLIISIILIIEMVYILTGRSG
jgi:phage shock protein PspC (stress-responsive transcriptional regulator)